MRVLRTAALVVGAVALIASGIGAAAGAGLIGATVGGVTTVAGIAASTFTAIGAVAGVAGTVLSLAAGLMAPTVATGPKGTLGGVPTAFKIDKEAGVPYAMGRTYVGGNVVHRQYWGSNNDYESWVVVSSLGPIDGYESLQIDNQAVEMAPDYSAIGFYNGFMWMKDQLGQLPDNTVLMTGADDIIPGWDASSRLSGLAAEIWTLRRDPDGQKYPAGVPKRARILRGVKVYDARKDSTYPGGVGPCRLGNEGTYVYSENPSCHAVTYAYGRYQNGHLVAGGGQPVSGIDLSAFVEWSNICDARNWKVGGLVYVTTDNDWDILKMIAQAGGGEVMPVGGMLSCIFSAPRVSIGTITRDDIMGDIDIPAGASRQSRINTVIPKIRSEEHGWEVIPLDPVTIDDYVTLDRGRRTKEVNYPLVQNVTQGAELASYEILNARELDQAVLPCKLYMVDYRPGDCLTVDIPEANLIDRDFIVRNREIDMGSMGVTFSCRSESAGKHDYAMGVTTTPPRTPDLSLPDLVPGEPSASDWSFWAGLGTDGQPILNLVGAVAQPDWETVRIEYRKIGAPDWTLVGTYRDLGHLRVSIPSVEGDTLYEARISYASRFAMGPSIALASVTTPHNRLRGVQDGDGHLIDPTEFLNHEIHLSADGRLTFPGGDLGGVELAAIDGASTTALEAVRDDAATALDAARAALESAMAGITENAGMTQAQVDALDVARVALEDALAHVADRVDVTRTDLAETTSDLLRLSDGAVEQLLQAVLRLTTEANRTRTVMRDAGITIDPATGSVHLYGVDVAMGRLNTVDVTLDAVKASIGLKASTTYVDNAIATAVLDPSQVPVFTGLEFRIATAELGLDGLTASLNLKATLVDLSATAARVTTAENAIDAPNGLVSTKVDSTTFTALDTRVASTEQQLLAIGDTASITDSVRIGRLLSDRVDDQDALTLASLLDGDLANRRQSAAVADARRELTARIVDGDQVEALARTALAGRLAQAEAGLVQEALIRVNAISALAQNILALNATLQTETAAREAAVETIQQALATETELRATDIRSVNVELRDRAEDAGDNATSGLHGILDADAAHRGAIRSMAAARQEITARLVDGETAEALARTALAARLNTAQASLLQELLVRVGVDEAQAQQISALSASLTIETGARQAAITSVQQSLVNLNSALSQAVTELTASIGDEAGTRGAAITAVQQARADGDAALASMINNLSATLSGDLGALSATVEARAQTSVDRDTALGTRIDTVAASVVSEAGTRSAAISSANQARADGDSALGIRIDTVHASVESEAGTRSAQITAANQARVDGDSALGARIDTVQASVTTETEARSAAVSAALLAIANGDEVLAGQLATIATTVGSNTATIETFLESLNGVLARAGVRLTAGGKIIGWSLNNDGEEGDFDVIADHVRFWKPDESASAAPFDFSGDKLELTADVEIDGNLNIRNGTLTADQFEANGVTRSYSAANGAAVGLSTSMSNIVSLPITMTRPGRIIVIATYQFTFEPIATWAAEITVNGDVLQSASSNRDGFLTLTWTYDAASAGTYTARARARGANGPSSGAPIINAGGCSMVVHRTYA